MLNDIKKFFFSKRRGGYAVLFAVLVSSIILAIGISVWSISLKDLLLSSVGRESRFAFYAADAGVDCAMYWEFQYGAFSTSTGPNEIACGGERSEVGGGNAAMDQSGNGTSTFTFHLDSVKGENGPCTTVAVGESYGGKGLLVRHIEGRGYNVCNINDPLRLERGLSVDLIPQ